MGAVDEFSDEERMKAVPNSAAITPSEIAVRIFSVRVHTGRRAPRLSGLFSDCCEVLITQLPKLFRKDY